MALGRGLATPLVLSKVRSWCSVPERSFQGFLSRRFFALTVLTHVSQIQDHLAPPYMGSHRGWPRPSCSWTGRPSHLGRLAGLRPAEQRAGPWRGRVLRAHAQGARLCFACGRDMGRRGAAGTCSSPTTGTRGPWNSLVWASAEEGPPCLGTLLSLARCAWGHQWGEGNKRAWCGRGFAMAEIPHL